MLIHITNYEMINSIYHFKFKGNPNHYSKSKKNTINSSKTKIWFSMIKKKKPAQIIKNQIKNIKEFLTLNVKDL